MMTASEKVACADAVVKAKDALRIATDNYNRSFRYLAAAQLDTAAKQQILTAAQTRYNEALAAIGEP